MPCVYLPCLDDLSTLMKSHSKNKGGVKFHPDAQSEKSDTPASPIGKFEGDVPRCISIPNADLKDVEYHEEKDTDCKFCASLFSESYLQAF